MKRLLLALACFTSLQAAETYTEKPGKEGDGAFEVGPEYRIDPDLTDKGNPTHNWLKSTCRRA